VKKTGRLVTTEDSFITCGVGAEIVARFTERAMDYLENVVRIACPDIPAPFSPHQKAYISDKDAIVKAIRNVV
jgi:pyruvate dehydrogenase E1 component beta subunit